MQSGVVSLICLLLLSACKASIYCTKPECKGEVAGVVTPDFQYDPEKNALHQDLSGSNILIIGDSRGIGQAFVAQMLEVLGDEGRVLGASRTAPEALREPLRTWHFNDQRYTHIVFDAQNTPSFAYERQATRNAAGSFEHVTPMPDSSDDYNRLRDAIREVLNDRVDHVIYAAGTICHANIADTDWAYFAAARGAHLADHAVWSVVKDKMTSEYSTWVSISSLDTRVHTDISQVGYHAAKLYKSGWIVDMHLATRAHPLYDKIRFVSLEPVFVNTTLADRDNVIFPPPAETCNQLSDRASFISQYILKNVRNSIVPLAFTQEISLELLEILARKDIGKPIKDKAGSVVPIRLTGAAGKATRGAVQQVVYGPVFDLLEDLWRNIPANQIENLALDGFFYGLLVARCNPLVIDDLVKEYGVTDAGVRQAIADRAVSPAFFASGIEEDILQNSRNAGKEGFLDLKYLVEGGSSERQEVLVDTGDLIYAAVIGINELTDTPEVAEEIGKKPGGFWSKGFPDTGLWFSSPTHGQGEREQNKMEGVRKIRDFDLGSVAFRGIDVP